MYFDDVKREVNIFLPNFIMLSKEKDRHDEIMMVKLITSFVLSKIYRIGVGAIATELNCKHSTVIYRVKVCQNRLKYDNIFKNKYETKLNEIKRCTIY